MRRGTLLLSGLLVILAACSVSRPAEPASIPPAPEPPAGWMSLGSFGGMGGTGTTAMSLTLGSAPVAVSATCMGSGDLVVVVADSASDAVRPAVGTAARFSCDPQRTTARAELSDAPTGDVTVSAFVVEGGGTIRHTTYNLSIEQPAEAAAQ